MVTPPTATRYSAAWVEQDIEAKPTRPLSPWLLAWLAFAPLAIFRAGELSEADTFWEIRTGLVTMAHRAIPATDTFTWTVHGRPYTLNSWGFNVLLAIAYRLADLPGVAWFGALITMGIVALALLLARQLGASPVGYGTTLLLAAPMLVGWLSARPQQVDYAGVLVLVLLLRRIGSGGGTWRLVALAGLLTFAWVNLHATALIAVAIAVMSALLFALRRRTECRWYAALAAAAMAAGCLANPYGLGILRQTAQVRADSVGLIVEWSPFNWVNPLQDLALAGCLTALVLAWRRREDALVAGLVVTIAGTISTVRMLPFAVVLAVPVLAARVQDPPAAIRRYLASRRIMLVRCGALGLAALTVIALPSLGHIGRPNPALYPVAVVNDIPPGCRVFTTDLLGGYVILARPDVPVSLDTRNNLYGRALLLAQERTLHGYGSVSSGLAGAGCVLVPPGYGLALQLRDDRQWRVRAANTVAVLFVRSPTEIPKFVPPG
jgi:hypothetical protein